MNRVIDVLKTWEARGPRSRALGLGLVGAFGLAAGISGCSDGIPSATDPDLIPVDAETFVVELPFEDFATAFRIDGGYGDPTDLAAARLAVDAESGAEARALVLWGAMPGSINVPPSDGGSAISDTAWTVVGGELVVRVDSARFAGAETFQLQAERVDELFDPVTASWTMAVDSVGERRAWTVPGGGDTQPLGGSEFEPALGDSVVIALDSASAASLGNRQLDRRSVVLRTSTDGAVLRVFDARLRLRARPASRPDTVVFVQPLGLDVTTIHSGNERQDPDAIVVGGAPAYRTSFRFQLPDEVPATGAALCGGPPTCFVELTADRLVYASLRLTTAEQGESILQPADTLSLDLRPALAPELLPRSPLGAPVQQSPRRVAPPAFAAGGERLVEVPLTRYLRDVIRPLEEGQEPVPTTVSLLSILEPSGLGIATFHGPGSDRGPRLRLILTRSPGVSLP